jgi:hypothetical protein
MYMKRVATAGGRERADLFLVVAEACGMAPALMEKDFWVCWTLGKLLTLPGVAGASHLPGFPHELAPLAI